MRDAYLEQVLPVVVERLDVVFPEFGWRRDRLGWVATNGEFTRSYLGARPDRVVAHGEAPRGFLVHGGEATLWTAYMNDGVIPRGNEFVQVVRELAERAGVDSKAIERSQPRDRRAELFNDFFALCRSELASERGTNAREYLTIARGIPADQVSSVGLGLVPDSARAGVALVRRGHAGVDIARSGVLADSRWPGRLCGLWSDGHGSAGTIWARTIEPASTKDKYLYLRGAKRRGLLPYGFGAVARQSSSQRVELVLVEGVLDTHQFRARGIDNVVALGGTSLRPEMFARLANEGVERVTLCLDNDQPGRAATGRAIGAAIRAAAAPELRVIDPSWLEPHTDPDAYVCHNGTEAWQTLTTNAHCAISWRAHELLNDITPSTDAAARKAALARAGTWLGRLPARLALEQEDTIHTLAKQCGYTPEAVARSFRARYWPPPECTRDPAHQARVRS